MIERCNTNRKEVIKRSTVFIVGERAKEALKIVAKNKMARINHNNDYTKTLSPKSLLIHSQNDQLITNSMHIINKMGGALLICDINYRIIITTGH